MKLYDVLKSYGLFVNDIKGRFSNNQITVNGDVVDMNFQFKGIIEVMDYGKFLNILSKNNLLKAYSSQIDFFGLEFLISDDHNIHNELTIFLKNYYLVKISKTDFLVIKIGSPKDTFSLNKEGTDPIDVTIQKETEVNINMDDLINRKEKLEKQLSNKKFIEKAPQFKVEEAKTKLKIVLEKIAELQ